MTATLRNIPGAPARHRGGPATALPWHTQTQWLGVTVRAFFFDPTEIDARASFVERYLPVFTQARPRRIGDDGQGLVFEAGDLSAQPDAVLEHGEGLLCLSFRRGDLLFMDPAHWPQQMRAESMLECIAMAMATAGARQRPTAALMRMSNALLQFSPSPQVLECLASSIGAARRYWGAPQAISAAQLAGFCEPRLRALPGIASGTAPASQLFNDEA